MTRTTASRDDVPAAGLARRGTRRTTDTDAPHHAVDARTWQGPPSPLGGGGPRGLSAQRYPVAYARDAVRL